MADKQICGECLHYHPIKVPSGKDTTRETGRAHCLAKSVYAKNKPGHPVYPPGARVEDLPYGRHNITVVRKTQEMPHCASFKKGKVKP